MLRQFFPKMILISVITLLLAACTTMIKPPIPLVSAGTGDSYSLAIAITPSGEKHLAWYQDQLAEDEILYWRTWLGPATITYDFVEPTGQPYSSPDIAATDDGIAYLVWNMVAGMSTYHHKYDIIPASGPFTPEAHDLDESFEYGVFPPRVVARGSSAFAVYDRTSTLYPCLYYQQLAGGIAGGTIYCTGNVNNELDEYGIDSAIDSTGKLHVGWKELHHNPSLTYRVIYNGGNMGQQWIVHDGNFFLGPVIAITGTGTNEKAHIVYTAECGENHCLYIASCKVASCTDQTTQTITLTSGWHHEGWRTLKAVGIGNTLWVAMILRDESFVHHDVWTYFTPGSTEPNRLTDTEYVKDNLSLVDSGGLPTLSWMGGASTGCENDIYFSNDLFGTRKIASSVCRDYKGVMAGSNGWVAGAWRAGLNPIKPRKVPWLAMNAYGGYMPVTAK
jgi:hypothetical protein